MRLATWLSVSLNDRRSWDRCPAAWMPDSLGALRICHVISWLIELECKGLTLKIQEDEYTEGKLEYKMSYGLSLKGKSRTNIHCKIITW